MTILKKSFVWYLIWLILFVFGALIGISLFFILGVFLLFLLWVQVRYWRKRKAVATIAYVTYLIGFAATFIFMIFVERQAYIALDWLGVIPGALLLSAIWPFYWAGIGILFWLDPFHGF